MSDDQPLYVPEDFEREHLDDARRSVANSRGGRAIARRMVSAGIVGRDPRHRRSRGIAGLVHAAASLLVVAIAAATGTWGVGLVMLGLVAVSLAVVIRVLHVVAEARERELAESPSPRPPQRRLN
jgi:hypothetical protein